MHFFTTRCKILASVALLLYQHPAVLATTTIPSGSLNSATSTSTNHPFSNGTCENRSFIPLLHVLPAVCARRERNVTNDGNTRSATAGIRTTTVSGGNSGHSSSDELPLGTAAVESASAARTADASENDDLDTDGALDESSFLSFEQWKDQMMQKAQGDPDTGYGGKDGERQRKADGLQEATDIVGEDGEIDMDFAPFLGHAGTLPDEEISTKQKSDDSVSGQPRIVKPKQRNKDASTCKERFNFALDKNGGQIMKTNPEAKAASAILSENRDIYMLNACNAKGKFLIVELSEPVLVEAVAIANFEFFSSTFRDFRISVSDRYPAKTDQWKVLGTFEARNSRDIQAFLIEDPRIWARYFRLELITHWGNEYYCPVSLLRVHGRNMIEDINQLSAPGDDDDDEDEFEDVAKETKEAKEAKAKVTEVVDNNANEELVTELVSEHNKEHWNQPEPLEQLEADLNSAYNSIIRDLVESISREEIITPWNKSYSLLSLFGSSELESTCVLSSTPVPCPTTNNHPLSISTVASLEPCSTRTPSSSPSSVHSDPTAAKRSSIIETSSSIRTTAQRGSDLVTSIAEPYSSINLVSSAVINTTATPTSRVSTASIPPASQPATQESFFKTVSKRLQLLEANATLSLKYIEEQSKILREAFSKVEKKQLRKTTDFLENLNGTVLAELRNFGRQYDQIWQSTVVELESQRDQSHRELAAVSLRLNLLADELVFQKRMSIAQSILLLLCLGLVVFSRLLAGGHIDVPGIQNMMGKPRNTSGRSMESAWNSPQVNKTVSLPSTQEEFYLGHRRQQSDVSTDSMKLQNGEGSPESPMSTYSGPEGHTRIYSRLADVSGREAQSPMSDEVIKHGLITPLDEPPDNNSQMDLSSGIEDPFKLHSMQLSRPTTSEQFNVMSESDGNPFHETTSFRLGKSVDGPSRDMETQVKNFHEPALDLPSIGKPRSFYHLPSPPPEQKNLASSISRKPLPAVPKE